MRKLAICLIALVFVTLTSATVFAGKKPDIAFDADVYKYDIISGKVARVHRSTIELEGDDREMCYHQDTKFFRGDNSVAIEKVYGEDVFKDCEKTSSFLIYKGDNIKARYTKLGNGAVCLEVILVVD